MNSMDIRNRRFEKGIGYKQDDVDSFLREVADALEVAVRKNEESEAKIVKLVEKINEYRVDSSAIAETMLNATKERNRIIAEANEEARRIIDAATAERDAKVAEIANDCEAIKKFQIEKISAAIREENDKLNAVIAASKTETQLQTEKLTKLRIEITDFKRKLLATLEEQAKIAGCLPELTDEEIMKIVSGQVRPEVPAPQPAVQPVPEEVKEPEQEIVPEVSEAVSQPKPAGKPAQRPDNFGFGEPAVKKTSNPFGDLRFGQKNNKK